MYWSISWIVNFICDSLLSSLLKTFLISLNIIDSIPRWHLSWTWMLVFLYDLWYSSMINIIIFERKIIWLCNVCVYTRSSPTCMGKTIYAFILSWHSYVSPWDMIYKSNIIHKKLIQAVICLNLPVITLLMWYRSTNVNFYRE